MSNATMYINVADDLEHCQPHMLAPKETEYLRMLSPLVGFKLPLSFFVLL